MNEFMALALLLNLAPAALVAQEVQQPAFTSHQINNSIVMLEPADTNGNVGVFFGDEAVLLIDSHYERNVEALVAEVAKLSDLPISFAVNTHIHPDHIGGNARLAGYGVTLVAHDKVRLRMLKELRIPRRGGITLPQPAEAARPVITYSEALSFHLNDEEVRIFLAPPAHTDGDSFVHFVDSDVLHLGDVFRTNMYPIIDQFNGGSFLGMIAAMQIAIDIAGPDTKVIPGHGGEVSDRAGMIEVHAMLLLLRDRIQAAIESGASLKEIAAMNLSQDIDGRWGSVPSWTFSDLLPIIESELRAQR
jgi:glyoxylase-like metal-dependent hydrolase (beta-lactamase superfamily II)